MPVIGDSGIQDSSEAGDTTQAMLDALIRKYGEEGRVMPSVT